jgi:hypothetical protein
MATHAEWDQGNDDKEAIVEVLNLKDLLGFQFVLL